MPLFTTFNHFRPHPTPKQLPVKHFFQGAVWKSHWPAWRDGYCSETLLQLLDVVFIKKVLQFLSILAYVTSLFRLTGASALYDFETLMQRNENHRVNARAHEFVLF